jgi:hypothetical protein
MVFRARLCDRDSAWIPVLATNRENVEMSKNECECTPPLIEVNKNTASIFTLKSVTYNPSTTLCFENGAAGYQSSAKMR